MNAQLCAGCSAHVCDLSEDSALIVRFPQDHVQCYAFLANGPGAVICPRCSNFNTFDFITIVVKPGVQAIIGVPEGKPDLESMAMLARDRISRIAPELDVVVLTNRRDFKRAFLKTFIDPAVVLCNEFSASGRDLAWFQERKHAFDYSFFTALWLTLTGAVQIYTREVGEYDGVSFVPHELAPNDARNVVAKRESLRRNTETAGALLGTLLISTVESLPAGGAVATLVERLGNLAPRLFLTDAVIAAAAETVGDMSVKLQDLAALRLHYLLELVLTLLCHACGKTNPRRTAWTEIAFLYEFLLWEAGQHADYVLEPDFMRSTLDEQWYWQTVGAFARQRGLSQVNAASMDTLSKLAETVGRLYPNELQERLRLRVSPAAGTTPAQFLETCKKVIDAVMAPVDVSLVCVYLDSLHEYAPDLLPNGVRFVFERLHQLPDTAPVDRCSMLSRLIEFLNKSGHARDADEMVSALKALIADPAFEQAEPVACAVALNELGNCLRIDEQYRESLALYDRSLALLNLGADDSRVRVAMRNRAIVLREMHFYTEAMHVCNSLLPHASSTEKRGILVTQAACLLEMGQSAEACKLLEGIASELDTVNFKSEHVLSVIALLGLLRLQVGRVNEARVLLLPAVEVARTQNYHTLLLVAELSSLQDEIEHDTAEQDTAIDAMHAILTRVGGGALDWLVMSVIIGLDRAMTQRGQTERAEQLIRELAQRADLELSPRCWQLHLIAAGHAARRGDIADRRQDVWTAMLAFQLGLANASAADDIASYTSPQGMAAAQMMTEALDVFGHDERESFALLLAADLRAAPVLTSRLRRREAFPFPLNDIEAEEERLRQLLQATPAVVLQFVGDGHQLSLVRTTLDQNGQLRSHVQRLPIDQLSVEKTAKSLSFALKTCQTAVRGQGYAHVAGWQELGAMLVKLTADLADESPLVVVAGPVGEAALSLAIGDRHPVCFVPSVGALISLRKRRLREGTLDAWRPGHLFTFATWFDRDKPAQVKALSAVAKSGAALALAFNLKGDHASGTHATGARLMAGLQQTDLAWLACHGGIRTGAESVDLYVAADGNLPTSDLNELNENRRNAHLVNWQALAALVTAPRVVVSSACDSGLTTTNPGGERLGLERPLFAAGAVVLAAPLWPVPTHDIQQHVERLLQQWLAAPGTSFALQVWRARKAGKEAGLMALATDAMAVFGDAL